MIAHFSKFRILPFNLTIQNLFTTTVEQMGSISSIIDGTNSESLILIMKLASYSPKFFDLIHTNHCLKQRLQSRIYGDKVPKQSFHDLPVNSYLNPE